MTRSSLSPERYITYTRAALWSLAIIVVSGGAVRLTGSGLGCSDWPNCQEDQLVADLEYHALIEFVNRLFTGLVTAAVVMAVLGSRRRIPYRRDLTWWSWGLVAGVGAQVVLGGLLVKADLDPRFTMGHFLLSMILVWNAVVLQHKAEESDHATPGPRAPGDHLQYAMRPWGRAVLALGTVLLVTGTIVTGAGPHSGSDDPDVAARLSVNIREVTRIHSIVAICLLALVVYVIRRASEANRADVRDRAVLVAALLVIQGVIGYLQYFNGVPVLLVAVHLTFATLTWMAIVRLELVASEAVHIRTPTPVA